MRPRSVEVIPYALPFKEPYVTARGVLTRREMVLLRIRTDEGREGLGEAVPLALRGGASLGQVVRELEEVANGDALAEFFARGPIPEIAEVSEIDPRLDLSPPSRTALLTALADLWLTAIAEAHGPDVEPAPVSCNATLVAGEPPAVAEDALRWHESGYRTFKLKVGGGDDLAQVRAVREALGPEALLRIDANAAWSLEDAERTLRELEPLDIELAEQPVATMEEAAQLVGTTSIPLAGDESIASRADAERALSLGAFGLTGIKLSKVGGYVDGVQVAEVMPSYVSSALDGPVGIAAAAMLAENVRHFNWPGNRERAHGLATQRLFASTIAAVECELRGGMLHPPPGPGLGVVIDEDALRAHRL